MDWAELVTKARIWWSEADTDTRYLVIVGASGFLSILALLLDKGTPRETLHRVRIENT